MSRTYKEITLSKEATARFDARHEKTDGCWLWTGSKNYGYGLILGPGFRHSAHRYSYLLHGGFLTPELVVCHKCDNPACVNPDHLFAGTQSDNGKDASNKGRTNRKRKRRTPFVLGVYGALASSKTRVKHE